MGSWKAWVPAMSQVMLSSCSLGRDCAVFFSVSVLHIVFNYGKEEIRIS